jgi:hypothetical protein
MKKIMIMAIAIVLLASCKKESTPVTRSITNSLQSDPDPSLPPLACGVGGGALFYGTMTIHGHVGKVHGPSVNKTCSATPDGKIAITSDDISYFANGDELWTKGNIVVTFPTDGSTTATITGGSTIVGGTGRFKGATGYFIYENMVVDLVTGHESHTSHGEITF